MEAPAADGLAEDGREDINQFTDVSGFTRPESELGGLLQHRSGLFVAGHQRDDSSHAVVLVS